MIHEQEARPVQRLGRYSPVRTGKLANVQGFETAALGIEVGRDDGLQSRNISVGRLPEVPSWQGFL